MIQLNLKFLRSLIKYPTFAHMLSSAFRLQPAGTGPRSTYTGGHFLVSIWFGFGLVLVLVLDFFFLFFFFLFLSSIRHTLAPRLKSEVSA